MGIKDTAAAIVLGLLLFGTSGLGLGAWLIIVVPLCAVLWCIWVLLETPPRALPDALRHHLHL